jgi:hypothetical protein
MVWALALTLQSARTNARHTKRLSLPMKHAPTFPGVVGFAFVDETEEII